MPYVNVNCPECAGKAWKECPVCHGGGTVRCPENCEHGVKRCPAGCNAGYSWDHVCDYCHGTFVDPYGKPCQACNSEGRMRCTTCNPVLVLGGGVPDQPGYVRCPRNCDAGHVACLVCTLHRFGAGKVGCEACQESGVIAVWEPDPVVAPDAVAYAPPPTETWAPQPPAEDPYAADRLREETERRQREEDERARQAEAQRLADEQRQRDAELATIEAERRRQEELAAAEAERRRQEELAAEEERRRNEGSA